MDRAKQQDCEVEEMIEILLNDITVDGMRRVKVMSDHRVTEAFMRRYVPGAAKGLEHVHCHDTAALSLFYGEVTWPVREVIRCQLTVDSLRLRNLVVWKFVAEEEYRLSEIIVFLADWYFVRAHHRPQFAFIRKLPNGIESCTEVEEVMLVQADWALNGCVMVGG